MGRPAEAISDACPSSGSDKTEAGSPGGLAAFASLCSEGFLEVAGTRIVAASERAARLLGHADAGEVIGLRLVDLLEPLDGRGAQDLRPGCSVRCAVRTQDASVVLRVSGREVGQERCVYALRDIAEKEEMEAALDDAGREIHGARRALRTLRDELAGELSERDELVATVAHELRTPVTVIGGYARLLLEEKAGPIRDEQRRFLEEMRRSCARLDEFVGVLLRTAHDQRAARHGCDASRLVAAPLEPLLGGMLEFLRPMLDQAGARLDVHVDPAAAWARFDAARIEQVLANLIVNAIRYAGHGGRIRVAAAPAHAGFVEISVTDDGPGIPPAERGRVFEPYFRGGRATETQGLGLGLAICKRIVAAHGGAISLRPGDGGRGCRFCFTLPAAEPKTQQMAGDAARSHRARGSRSRGQR